MIKFLCDECEAETDFESGRWVVRVIRQVTDGDTDKIWCNVCAPAGFAKLHAKLNAMNQEKGT